MGKWHRLMILAMFCVFAQACNSTDVAQVDNSTPSENTLKQKWHPKTSVEQLTPNVVEGIQIYGAKAIAEQCKREAWLGWCDSPLPQFRHGALPVEKARQISRSVFNGYIYTADVVDSWNSYSALQLKGVIWYGDCDDLTSTTLDMLYRSGQPIDKMWMLLVNVRSHGTLDHIIGVIQDDQDRYWIVGDTNPRNVYPLAELKYSPRAIMRMDQRGNWVSALDTPLFAKYPAILGRQAEASAPLPTKHRSHK